jgi:molecular chaperone Hsp33
MSIAGELRLPGIQDQDRVLPFQIEHQDVRGRILRLGDSLNAILAAHSYPAVVAELLGEALVLTALVGSVLSGDGKITLQARAKGAIRMLVCDFTGHGQLRGYVDFDGDAVAALPAQPDLEALFGPEGYLALTLDTVPDNERYQGIVPLAGSGLADAAATYFESSEQIPTAVRLGVRFDGLKQRWMAGGLLIQHLPKGEIGGERLDVTRETDEDGWRRAGILAQSVTFEELTDPDLALETVLVRLFHEDGVRVFNQTAVTKGCPCTPDRLRGILSQFSATDLVDMRDASGTIHMTCAFCSREFPIEMSGLS